MEIRPFPRNPNYGVSRCGKIFRIVRAKFGHAVPYEMKPSFDRKGYPVVGNGSGKGLQRVAVHRAVAETFIPNPDGLPEVAHDDGVKTHNAAENLRWSSHAGNQADRLRHGTSNRGTRQGLHKLTEADVFGLRNGLISAREIAALRGAGEKHVREVQKGKDWPHV